MKFDVQFRSRGPPCKYRFVREVERGNERKKRHIKDQLLCPSHRRRRRRLAPPVPCGTIKSRDAISHELKGVNLKAGK